MKIHVSASTDIGNTKTTNQDSLLVTTAQTSIGEVAFAVLCDGMGGLAKGEVASASVVEQFDQWFTLELPLQIQNGLEDGEIRNTWTKMIKLQNEKIQAYGKQQGIHLGTTITVMLLTPFRYYIGNVGDTRAYEITSNQIQALTEDQTVVEQEVRQGLLTREQAKVDIRRSILLQCIGASKEVYPVFTFGIPKKDTVYMLCSDGFRHEVNEQEIAQVLSPLAMSSKEAMVRRERELIDLNKQRKEKDNISVITIRTY